MAINLLLMGFCPFPHEFSDHDLATFIGAHPDLSGQHIEGIPEYYQLVKGSELCNVRLVRIRDVRHQNNDLTLIIFKELPIDPDDDFEWLTSPEYDQAFSDALVKVYRDFNITSDVPMEQFFLPGKAVIIYSGIAAQVETLTTETRREFMRITNPT